MAPLGFEPFIPTSERPQTHVLDRTAAGVGVEVEMAIGKLKIVKSPGMDQYAVEMIQCREGKHHVSRYTELFEIVVGALTTCTQYT